MLLGILAQLVDVQQTETTSAMYDVGLSVDPWIHVLLSHCKSRLEFDRSPAM